MKKLLYNPSCYYINIFIFQINKLDDFFRYILRILHEQIDKLHNMWYDF